VRETVFQPIRPKRVSEEIVQQIKDLIARGSLAPGERFPPEREMALQLNVSRPTLREAIQVLEHLGLVRSVHGDGTYVLDVGEQCLRDPLHSLILESDHRIVELAEFRTAIESWAVGLAAGRIQPKDVSLLKEILEEMEEGLNAGRSIHHLDAEFHLTIARASQNGIYFHVANTIFYLFAEVTRLSHERIFVSRRDQEGLLEEHRGIFGALQRGDSSGARRLMNQHLRSTERWFKRSITSNHKGGQTE
jgi:GntR family transcriptional regulator, transcriptional repressor for pyruvate dehydrogenase complex